MRLPWPLPALIGWMLAWGVWALARQSGLAVGLALGASLLPGVLLALAAPAGWRRWLVACGFPLALFATGSAVLPATAWLVLLAALLLLYPLRAWRDAPLFPTPREALVALPEHAPMPPGARLLDAGCGLGHGLQALRLAYPQARIEGIESSWPLLLLCKLRCPWARVRAGDLWRQDWAPFDLVYLFQRPESMPRAARKAQQELRPGAWLVSLEFEAQALVPSCSLRLPDGRALWIYRIGVAGDATQRK